MREGTANINRLPIMVSMAGAPRERMANSEWRVENRDRL
jgi:hypothetical protein